MYKLVLIRHGESTWNLENRFTGWTDVDLTPQGVEEARAAGRLLAADLTGATTLPRDGRLSVVRRDPDLEALHDAAARVTADRGAWWRDRLARCLTLLGEDS